MLIKQALNSVNSMAGLDACMKVNAIGVTILEESLFRALQQYFLLCPPPRVTAFIVEVTSSLVGQEKHYKDQVEACPDISQVPHIVVGHIHQFY